MTSADTLLFFDTNPVHHELIEYFKQFSINLIQKRDLSSLDCIKTAPSAVIIHWSLLKNNPSTIKTIYQGLNVPIIVVKDKQDKEEGITALESGADDFLTLPLNPRELHARITAINRRVVKSKTGKESQKEVFLFANWRLYPSSRQVFDDQGTELTLSVGEYELLNAFVHHPQEILNRDYLLQVTKHTEHNPQDRRIDVQISRLRHKIEPSAKRHTLIKTIRNGGYLFTAKVLTLKENEV